MCVHESYYEEEIEPGLAALVPKHVRILKTNAVPSRFTRALGIGDLSLRGWRPLRRALLQLLKTEPIGAVLITGAPFYSMLFAPGIKRRFGVPVVLDFQDPWVSAWGATQFSLSKSGVAHNVANFLEPRALKGADFVTSVSEVQNKEMAARYPWFDASRMAGIPIGGDPDDFLNARSSLELGDKEYLDTSAINLSYVGTFLPRSAQVVSTVFRAVARLRKTEPELTARIRLNFIGTSNQPKSGQAYRIKPLADAEGIGDLVREIPRRLPFLRALGVISRSDGLLLLGSDEPHYTASKIYPALMSRRPYISLFHAKSSAHHILTMAGGGQSFAFSSATELAALESSVTAGLRKLAFEPQKMGLADPSSYAAFEARAIAARFGHIFDSLHARD